MRDMERFELKLNEQYGQYMNQNYCEAFCSEIKSLVDTKYWKSLKEWKNGRINITDVIIPKLSAEEGQWSLIEVATRLCEDYPNIPVAAFLLFLAEENPITLGAILSIAEEFCWADPAFIEQDNTECTCAFLNEEEGQWVFLADDTDPTVLREYQIWQVLLQIPVLAVLISYDHSLGTAIELWNDGIYHVISPKSNES